MSVPLRGPGAWVVCPDDAQGFGSLGFRSFSTNHLHPQRKETA
jgi:hypothetical protein